MMNPHVTLSDVDIEITVNEKLNDDVNSTTISTTSNDDDETSTVPSSKSKIFQYKYGIATSMCFVMVMIIIIVTALTIDRSSHTNISSSEEELQATTIAYYKEFAAYFKSLIAATVCPNNINIVAPPLPGKKGVALRLNDNGNEGNSVKNVPIVQKLRPYWNYNWQLQRSIHQPDDIEWIPMVWGGNNKEDVQQRIQSLVVPHIQSGKVKRILGFNEPDLDEQSNMDVDRALSIWPTIQSSTNVSIISPSCASQSNGWMQYFMINITVTCQRVDWVGIHWYGSANFNYFTQTITYYYEMYGRRPLMITEFAVADFDATTIEENRNSRPAVLAFMKKAVPWLESKPWIAGYAWFPYNIKDPKGYSSALFNNAGSLTLLGQYYASVRTETPKGNQSIAHYVWKGN